MSFFERKHIPTPESVMQSIEDEFDGADLDCPRGCIQVIWASDARVNGRMVVYLASVNEEGKSMLLEDEELDCKTPDGNIITIGN